MPYPTELQNWRFCSYLHQTKRVEDPQDVIVGEEVHIKKSTPAPTNTRRREERQENLQEDLGTDGPG